MLDQQGLAHAIRMKAIIPCLGQSPPDQARALGLALLNPDRLNGDLSRSLPNARELVTALMRDDVTREGIFQAMVEHRYDADTWIEYDAIAAYVTRGDFRKALVTAQMTMGLHDDEDLGDRDRDAWLYGYCCAALLGRPFPDDPVDAGRTAERVFPASLENSESASAWTAYRYIRGGLSYADAIRDMSPDWVDFLTQCHGLRLLGTGHLPEAVALLDQQCATFGKRTHLGYQQGALLSLWDLFKRRAAKGTPTTATWTDPLPLLPRITLPPADKPTGNNF